MNINSLILTKIKCLFNKNYQKKDPKKRIKEKRKEARRWKLEVISSYKKMLPARITILTILNPLLF